MVIDIVTPTLNRDEFLEKTLLSVTTQKVNSKINYYVMDGGSIDNTINIVNKHKRKLSNKNVEIHLTIGQDKGMYDAIYKGFSQGSGDIMAWINSDDVYMPNALHTIETIFNQHSNIDWIIGIPTHINSMDEIIGIQNSFPLKSRSGIQRGIYNFKNSRRLCPTIQQDAIFWRRSLWEKLPKDFFEVFRNSKYAGDLFLWKEFALHSGLYHVHSILSCFRIHGNQLTNELAKYEFEINTTSPSIKESFISLLLNLPIYAPRIIKSSIVKTRHHALCKRHSCALISWNFASNSWEIEPKVLD